MKLTFVLLLCVMSQVFALASAQTVSLKKQNASLEEILWELKEKTQLVFMYSDEDIASVKGIDIDMKNTQVDAILNKCLEGTDLKYVRENNAIVIRRSRQSENVPQVRMRKISGKVTDTSGDPLPGVTILVDGTTIGVATDNEGKYSLECPEAPDLALNFTFMGMKSQKVTVGPKNVIDVTLKEEMNRLEEAVAVGYGTTKVKDMTGAVTRLGSKDMETAPMGATIQSMLQGKAPGVNVMISSASPTSPVSVIIRGSSSLSGDSQPLWVIDGVPEYNASTSGDVSNTLYNLNLTDVESIDILKDASATAQKWAEQFAKTDVCPECKGARLNREALHFRIHDKNIYELASMDINELYDWLMKVDEFLEDKQRRIASEILKEIRTRLRFLLDVGLDYLSLNRTSVSLSGGESQRIRLATQIGSQLVNVLYILDEPSIGLHQRDNLRLINSLKKLRDTGNSVIVVEHDKDMMLAADYVVDMGPKAGRLGGEVVFAGTPQEMLNTETLTSQYLNGKMKLEIPSERREGNGKSLWLKGARGNNLKNVDVEFPLGKLICVTGVSGSGKSTLINDTLQPILSQHFYRSLQDPLAYDSIEGLENIDKVVNVDQSPLGRTPRSNPATYTGVFSDIRNLFVNLPEAKIRGYKPGRFSFNVTGGRCEACGGNGYKTIEMNFLPDVLVPCEVCHGKRYNRETLEVRFKGKSIADVLDMTINRAVEFFENVPQILNKIKVLQEVGLGYIKLGQPSTTLSGGESQRVKLATELSKRDTGKTLYILDEPTTGLHFEDIRVLMTVLNRLVDKGNTVIVIEHNLDVIKLADYIIDMGPEGGRGGGQLLSTGTPEEVAKSSKGYTPRFIKEELKN